MRPTRIYVHGIGVVSPAGWGLEAFRGVLDGGRTVEPVVLAHPDGKPRRARRVPVPTTRPPWMGHPRMRRSSVISQFAMAASLEALGFGQTIREFGGLGILASMMGGSVLYSGRFFGEVRSDPATASPLLFPETVFNAPASHLAAAFQTRARNDTLVGDESGFLNCLGQAAHWLEDGRLEACLVVASEELDWTNAGAVGEFPGTAIPAEGAAALLLKREPSPVELTGISSPFPSIGRGPTASDLQALHRELAPGLDAHPFEMGYRIPEHRSMLEERFGQGLAVVGGWACVAAVDALLAQRAASSVVVVAGSNHQTLGCSFQAPSPPPETPVEQVHSEACFAASPRTPGVLRSVP